MPIQKISQLPVLPIPQLDVGDTLVLVHGGITYQCAVQALINYLPPGPAGDATMRTQEVAALEYDLTRQDVGAYIRFVTDGVKECTVSTSYTFDSGLSFTVANRASSGDLTLVGDGVTLNAPSGGSLVLSPGDTAVIKMVAVDEADVYGQTVP